ncbi:hypothetical protein [Caldicellulosiruptor bescii]|uniref:hypothetical protein n=1 Tax=Caldicellulosiruptor bescii TaxID=31899 RepID=UPI001E3AE0C7|nr:hypothetical protein [Caldicellulosiruptor bescii]
MIRNVKSGNISNDAQVLRRVAYADVINDRIFAYLLDEFNDEYIITEKEWEEIKQRLGSIYYERHGLIYSIEQELRYFIPKMTQKERELNMKCLTICVVQSAGRKHTTDSQKHRHGSATALQSAFKPLIVGFY